MTRTKVIILLVALATILPSCNTKVPEEQGLGWPEITQQTKPWTRWWWPASAFENSDVDYALDSYAEVGLGGMEVTTIYGAKGYEDKYREYLSPEWMDLFTYTLESAKRHSLGIDLANASGWPFGGSWVTPDYACRYLAHKNFKLKGGESLDEPILYKERAMVRTIGAKDDISRMSYPIATNDSLQQHAYEQVRYPLDLPLIAVTANSADGQFLELTDKVAEDGTLNWTAPEGDWTICALFLGWHGKMVERAGPGGEGDVIDHFSESAIKRYLAKFDESFKGYDVSGIRYYFNDSYEVDDAAGNSDWTEDFFNQFKARRGYDLKAHMPELLGLSEDVDKSERVLFDYRETIGDLLIDTYSSKWQEWAAKQGKGIRNQAHGSPANILDVYAVSDVPETEGRSIIGMKTASSASHVCDKPLTSSESATWLGDHFRSKLSDVKTCLDDYFLAGVNHIFYHGTCFSREDAPWPGWLFYAAVHFQPTNSFWDDFKYLNEYVARCQSFLQAGRPDNDILLFFDATDLLSSRKDDRGRSELLFHMTQHTPVQSAIGVSASALSDKGYSWDFISDKMLCNDVAVKGGKILTRGGNSYKTIVIPKCQKMILGSFEKILSLAKGGATVMIEGGLPEDVPGLSDLEASRKKLSELKAKLQFNEDAGVSVAKWGKGLIMVSDELDEMLSRAGITREPMYDLGLQCIRRTKRDGGKYYFIKNSSAETVETTLGLDAVAKSVAIYNPMTGKAGYGKVSEGEEGRAEVFVKLLPDESLILETFSGEFSGEPYEFYSELSESKAIEGTWTVEFTKGGPALPQSLETNALGSWTEYGEDYKDFSGTASYSIKLEGLEGAKSSTWILSLGDVRNSARVYLDDQFVGAVIGSPYELTLSGEQVQKGGVLKVLVSSSSENRIAYMDRNNIPWRIFYNANIAARTPQSRGADGFFSAASWESVPSGLLGPVVLKKAKTL